MSASKKTHDAVAAKLKRSQDRAGMTPEQRAAQNRRVADEVERQGKGIAKQPRGAKSKWGRKK